MTDVRSCEQCGAEFTPRREHGRFCSARCRVAWNRGKAVGVPAAASPLQWSITAMLDTTERLPRITGLDRAKAFAIIGEAVWWVTIVDGTLVRYHPENYDAVLASQPAAERKRVEDTLGGLRFVRNRMGHDIDHVDFICGASGARRRVTDWRWSSLPELTFDWLSPRGQEWELERYRAYQGQLAGHPVGETFSRATAFLKVAVERAVGELPLAAS
jgi:hypothetical protein